MKYIIQQYIDSFSIFQINQIMSQPRRKQSLFTAKFSPGEAMFTQNNWIIDRNLGSIKVYESSEIMQVSGWENTHLKPSHIISYQCTDSPSQFSCRWNLTCIAWIHDEFGMMKYSYITYDYNGKLLWLMIEALHKNYRWKSDLMLCTGEVKEGVCLPMGPIIT